MTHMRWVHGQSGHESTIKQSVVPCVGGLRAWPIDRCSDKDVGESERKTPIPCVETNRQKSEAKTKTEQHTTRNVAWTGPDTSPEHLSARIISRWSSAGVHSCFQTSVTDMQTVLSVTTPVGLLAKTPQLRTSLCGLVSAVPKGVEVNQRHVAGWKHLRVGEVGTSQAR